MRILEERGASVSEGELLEAVNVRPGQLALLLKTLEIEGAIAATDARWSRTATEWTFDHERVESVTALRRTEQAQMNDYARATTCRMQMLRGFLDDADSGPCGICDNCTGESLAIELDPALVERAADFIRSAERIIESRKQLPNRTKIAADRVLQFGRVLRCGAMGDGARSCAMRARSSTAASTTSSSPRRPS